ncbi:MAG: uroporphyrinogen decarboxylase [Acidisphaera sp.]|nr:uroporphyrinogen decarboxylase [Acidisphaera sp.]
MSEKRLLRVLAGESVWPPPVWLMRQAGRYLPEYRALRAQAGDFIALCTSPELAAEVTLQPLRRFGMDGAILFSDILILPWALGQGLRYAEGEGPVLPPIRDAEGVAALDPSRLQAAVAPIMETVRRVRAEVGEATLIGFAGAPFTVVSYMVEGGGSKEFATVRAMAFRQPDLFARLMEIVTAATVEYLALQVEAGAEAVMLFDSWSGVLSPGLFEAHVIAPSARIVRELRARFPGLRILGFPRLAGVSVGAYAARTGVDAIGVDTSADLATVATLLPSHVATQGNLDPMALAAGGEALRREIERVLRAARGRPHVFNLGHGVVPGTPPEHVATLMQQVRAA